MANQREEEGKFLVYYGGRPGKRGKTIPFMSLIDKLPIEFRLKEIGQWSEWRMIMELRNIDFKKSFMRLTGEEGIIATIDKSCDFLRNLPEIKGYCLDESISAIESYADRLRDLVSIAYDKPQKGGRTKIPKQITNAIGYMESHLIIILAYCGKAANRLECSRTIAEFLNCNLEIIRSESIKANDRIWTVRNELRMAHRPLTLPDLERLFSLCSPWIIDEHYDDLAKALSPPKL